MDAQALGLLLERLGGHAEIGVAGVLAIEPRIDRLPEQWGDVPLTHADVSKAKELLGYEARTGFQEGIQRFVEWMKQEEAP